MTSAKEAVENKSYDAVVVGSGPNGLAAAITLARAGRTVLVIEGQETFGGGLRSAELTLPGFIHDVCSAIHPLGIASEFFRSLPLHEYGLEWIHPSAPLAHPLDDSVAVLERSTTATGEWLGRDAATYQRLFDPFVEGWEKLLGDTMGPLRLPRHPILLARFGMRSVVPAQYLAKIIFGRPESRALFGGIAAHAMMPLNRIPTTAFGLLLGALAHAVGWPVARGGSQSIANALVEYLRSLGGEIVTGVPIRSLKDLPDHRSALFDVSPRQLVELCGDRLPSGYRRKLQHFRTGPGVFKLDLALDGPVPWRRPECLRAGTVHVAGTLSELAASAQAVNKGRHPEKPFVLVGQQSLFDETRAPEGKQTVWAYCHVPNGSTFDMTGRIEAQIERFAPSFRDRILARSIMTPADLQHHNADLIGGDISGGAVTLKQLIARPIFSLDPYATPANGIYLCSASTPPGSGVHGMCGFHAAKAALSHEL